MSALYHQVALCAGRNPAFEIQQESFRGTGRGVGSCHAGTLIFAVLCPCFLLLFFPSNVSACKCQQKNEISIFIPNLPLGTGSDVGFEV